MANGESSPPGGVKSPWSVPLEGGLDLDWRMTPRRESGTSEKAPDLVLCGADDETRTRDIHLGKVMLYQLSYIRMRVDSIATVLGATTDPCGFCLIRRGLGRSTPCAVPTRAR